MAVAIISIQFFEQLLFVHILLEDGCSFDCVDLEINKKVCQHNENQSSGGKSVVFRAFFPPKRVIITSVETCLHLLISKYKGNTTYKFYYAKFKFKCELQLQQRL